MASSMQELLLRLSHDYSNDLCLGFELGTIYAYLSNGQDIEESHISESLRAHILEMCRIFSRSPAFSQSDTPGYLLFSTRPILKLVPAP